MIAKGMTIFGFVINLFFLIGAVQKLLPYTQINTNIHFLGLFWPTFVWLTFTVVNVMFLRYLIKLEKVKLITNKHVFFSVLLFLTPHVVSYLLGLYFTLQFINAINF